MILKSKGFTIFMLGLNMILLAYWVTLIINDFSMDMTTGSILRHFILAGMEFWLVYHYSNDYSNKVWQNKDDKNE